MLLFFFMVATVLRDNSLMIQNVLPAADQIQKLKIRLSKLYLEKSGQEGFTDFDVEYTKFLKSETEAMQIGRALKETDKLDPLAYLIVGDSADAIYTERWQRISSSVLHMVAQAQNQPQPPQQ